LVLQYSDTVATEIDILLQEIAAKESKKDHSFIYPCFIISKHDTHQKNFTLDSLDKQSHLLFIAVEPSEAAKYHKMISEQLDDMKIILVVLPKDNLKPSVILEMAKQIAIHFKFK
jgi:hypothetical protein